VFVDLLAMNRAYNLFNAIFMVRPLPTIGIAGVTAYIISKNVIIKNLVIAYYYCSLIIM